MANNVEFAANMWHYASLNFTGTQLRDTSGEELTIVTVLIFSCPYSQAIATPCHPSVRRLSVTFCIVAKLCIVGIGDGTVG